MTTITVTAEDRRGFPWLAVLLIVAVALGAWTLANAPEAVAVDLPTVEVDGLEIQQSGDHGAAQHGADYYATLTACQNNGVKHRYLEPDNKTVHLLCDLGDGRYGDLIYLRETEKNGGFVRFIKTGFIPKSGKLLDIQAWLARKSVHHLMRPY